MRFLLTVLAIWSSAHAYIIVRIHRYGGLHSRATAAVALGLFALMFCPFLGYALHRGGRAHLAAAVSGLGMIYAGTFSILLCVSLAHDLWNGLVWALSLVAPATSAAKFTGRTALAADFFFTAVLVLYALLEAWSIRVEMVRVSSPRLPADLGPLRVVQISDVHLGMSVGRARLARIVRIVKAAKPDILVSTGDLVDAEMADMAELAQILAKVDAPLGKYAVTGNHEFYGGLSQSIAFTERAGFKVLLNEAVQVRPGLTVAGMHDPVVARWQGGRLPDERLTFQQASKGDFLILLKHRPFVQADSVGLINLQLSGHTHRGQIFPFSLIVAAVYQHPHGLVRLGPDTWLYTSRGTGTWGPPMRLFNPPEVTVIEVTSDGFGRD